VIAYIKPKIILLDDDQPLLEVIHYYFTEQFENHVDLISFSNSNDFLSYIEKYCYLTDSPLEIISSFYEGNRSRGAAEKTLKDLSVLSATIVLDHELREEKITGIELSNQIRQYYPSSFISMLTSNVHSDEAIKLHNNHDIDVFVDKKNTDAIHILYTFLSKHIKEQENSFMLDSTDIFNNTDILNSIDYTEQKNLLLENIAPISFLTLNENGDIAILNKSSHVYFWRYTPSEKRFVAYE